MSLVLEIRDLVVEYESRADLFHWHPPSVRAVDRVSLEIERGTTLGLVGESGSGKTSVARAVLGLVPHQGTVRLLGESASRSRRAHADTRRHVQMVFQQPTASLDPTMRIGATIAEPLVHLLGMHGSSLSNRVRDLLSLVGLEQEYARRYPYQLSGGQRQRVAIARALAPSPELVICDEPTSSLDVSVQAQIVNLLVMLQEDLHVSYLFISHDLGLIRQVADRVSVMHGGRIVESGNVEEVLQSPVDQYTKTLMEAVPSL